MKDTDTDRNYVVYVHKDSEGNIRYVGSGRLVRAFSNNSKSSRGLLYESFVNDNGKLSVSVLKTNLSKQESIEEEIKLYDELVLTGLLLNSRRPLGVLDLPSVEYLNTLLYYDETSPSGLRWKIARANNISIDDPAGSITQKGRWVVSIDKRFYMVHRIVALLHGHNISKSVCIDHIDNNPLNNKISNLRVCTHAENARNRLQSASRKSNFGVGVKFHKTKQYFEAQVSDPRLHTNRGGAKRISKCFSVKKYGYDEALRLAIAARKTLLAELECLAGLNYSDNYK